MFKTLDVLTEQQCADVRSVVHRLRPWWIQRHPWVPFYSLGAASYLDAVDRDAYYNRASLYNPLLREPFQWLYDRLAHLLARTLEAPVVYPEKLALPGFHVFLGARIFEQPVAPVHRDLQYKLLEWDCMSNELDISNVVSFTLAITLPEAGGGLNVWDDQNVTYIPYRTGSLVLQYGDPLHQIAPTTRVQPGDERITLQGHGLLREGRWNLYW